MSIDEIERLVKEKADQQIDKVFGLLFSVFERQFRGQMRVVLGGKEIDNIEMVSIDYRADRPFPAPPYIIVNYERYLGQTKIQSSCEFNDIKLFPKQLYFDEKNYIQFFDEGD